MAMPHELAFLPTYLIGCSLCSMLQLGQLLVFVARLTLQTLLPVSVGYVSPSKLSSNWWLLCTELFTGLCLVTCLISWAALLTCCLGVDFGRQLPTNLLSVCRVLSQMANDHLLLLAESCGTVFPMTLHLLHHWQCFRKNWKHIYFGSHIRTLLCM